MNLQQLAQLQTELARGRGGRQKVPPEGWTFEEVQAWLGSIAMAEYKEIFFNSKIDGSMLCELTEADISHPKGLNIANFMHRKRLMKAIQVLKEFQATV